jgi:hypothetical protein
MKGTSKTSRLVYALMLAAMLLFPQSIWSQDIINQSNLFVPDGMEFHIDGNFANEGFVLNQGSFFVTGDWKNTNIYQGLGLVVLNGSQDQAFFNNKNAVALLSIDGLGVKHINDLVPVTSELHLLSGIVRVGGPDTLTLGQNAIIKGGSSQSYVEGPLTYIGTGYKFFPIGKNGNYNPVEMLDITGINPMISLELHENLPAIDAPEDVTVYRNVYWERKTVRGTYLESPISIGYDVPDNFTSRHMIEILEGDDLTAPFTKIGPVTVTDDNALDKVTSENGLAKSIFVIGGSTPPDGLPGRFYFSTSLSRHAADPDNQVVKVFGDQLTGESFRFLVFNRWGKVVYESNSLKEMIVNGWDGTSQGGGQFLPSGSYPFILQDKMKNGERMEKKGVISIVN